MNISPDDLSYWYLRLNGFLTTVNFVVHPDQGGNQRTDVDILGVRFPFRSELQLNPMQDDPVLILSPSKPTIVLAEAKTSLCRLNGPWTKEEDENMQRVTRSIGFITIDEVKAVATSLYIHGQWENDLYFVSLICFGRDENDELRERYPNVPQITWIDVMRFIFGRFHQYSQQKASHPQWDQNGRNLWHAAFSSADPDEMLSCFNITNPLNQL